MSFYSEDHVRILPVSSTRMTSSFSDLQPASVGCIELSELFTHVSSVHVFRSCFHSHRGGLVSSAVRSSWLRPVDVLITSTLRLQVLTPSSSPGFRQHREGVGNLVFYRLVTEELCFTFLSLRESNPNRAV